MSQKFGDTINEITSFQNIENTFLLLSQAELASWHSGTGHTIQEIRLSIIPVAGNEKENAQKSI